MILLTLALAGATPGCSTQAPVAPPAASAPAAEAARPQVDVAFLHARRADIPVLVDVRTKKEYDAGHVPGALHLPLQELGDRLGELEVWRGGPVYLICQSGGRSARAQAQLSAAGFTAVNVVGGTGAWKAAGYPLE